MTPLPVVIIGGYLGAGKTTLINHVLRDAGGRRVAVLVNDFGEINIDADLIEGAAAGVLSLSGGCLCCSFGDDLVGTLQALSQGDARPDVVLIELSGVALPAPVARSIKLARGAEVAGTLVLVDASAIQRQIGDRYVGDTVRQQLRDADRILVNRSGLLTPGAQHEQSGWLAGIAPLAQIMASDAHDIDSDLVLGWRAEPPDSQHVLAAMEARPIGRSRLCAQDVFSSRSFTLGASMDLSELGRALAAHDFGALRAKGLTVDASGRGRALQVSAGHWQIDVAPAPDNARLVVIGPRESMASDPLFFSRLGL
ncbi:MAG: CobW family GTP-binding protein [Rhodoferax sp.]